MKFFKVISIFIFTILILGVGYASEDFQNTTKITFEGVEFSIPGGFHSSAKIADYNELGSEGKTCFYNNGLNETIEITVISDWMGISLDDFKRDGAFKKSINGHSGWSFKENNLNYFGYVKGDDGILVGTSNQSALYEIIL